MFTFATLEVAATCGFLNAIWWMTKKSASISNNFSE